MVEESVYVVVNDSNIISPKKNEEIDIEIDKNFEKLSLKNIKEGPSNNDISLQENIVEEKENHRSLQRENML